MNRLDFESDQIPFNASPLARDTAVKSTGLVVGRRRLLLEVSEMLLFACLHTRSSSFGRFVRETSKNSKTRMIYCRQIHRTTALRLTTSPVRSLYDKGNLIKKRKIKLKYMSTVSSGHMSRVSPASRLGV